MSALKLRKYVNKMAFDHCVSVPAAALSGLGAANREDQAVDVAAALNTRST
jgi:hypothetical protein